MKVAQLPLVLLGLITLGNILLGQTLPANAQSVTESTQVVSEQTPRSFKEKMLEERAKAGTNEWQTGSQTSMAAQGFKMTQGLALCIGAFLIGFGLFRRFNNRTNQVANRRVKILDRISVASKTSLILIEVEGQKYLMTVGSDRANLVPISRRQSDRTAFDDSINLLCERDLKLSQAV